MPRKNSKKDNSGFHNWRLLIWVAPVVIIFVLLTLYFFGVNSIDTAILDVGSNSDLSGYFRLSEDNSNLSARQNDGGLTYRYLDGTAYVIYDGPRAPGLSLVNVKLFGEDVYFKKLPSIDSANWDYNFNFNSFVDNSNQKILKSNPISLDSILSSSEEINFADLDLSKDLFAIKVVYNSKPEVSLLEGDLSLTQDILGVSLNFGSEKLFYKLPDFFIGKEHTIIVSYLGKVVYLFVDGELAGRMRVDDSVKSFSVSKDIKNNQVKFYAVDALKINGDDGSCFNFDGNTQLILPDSVGKDNLFNSGPFYVYLEWVPEDMRDSQQLIGRYSWEIYQNSNSVSLVVGRLNDKNGPFVSIIHKIGKSFFNEKHNLLMVYNPAEKNKRNGYLELYIDGISVGSQFLDQDKIWPSYVQGRPLSMGQTFHGSANLNTYFRGLVCNVKFKQAMLAVSKTKEINLVSDNPEIILPILGENGKLEKLEITVSPNNK